MSKKEFKMLDRWQIKKIVNSISLNRIGPSLLSGAITKTFLSPFKMYLKTREDEMRKETPGAGKRQYRKMIT